MFHNISAEEFNRIADIGNTNCLAFALGQTESSSETYQGKYILPYWDREGRRMLISEAFKRTASNLGIHVKMVSKAEQGHVYFLVFGWYSNGNFHVVRQNSDGSLEHKPDWYNPARKTTLEELYDSGHYNPFIFQLL